jgi:hypothetical protein
MYLENSLQAQKRDYIYDYNEEMGKNYAELSKKHRFLNFNSLRGYALKILWLDKF